MADTRPSGVPVIPDDEALVTQELVEIDKRGRLHLLPRWAKHISWLPLPATNDLDALMILMEPGRLCLTSWLPDGPRILERYRSIALEADPGLEVLRSIQDRYQILHIPKKERRAHLGDAALQHLGLPTTRGASSNAYVVLFPDRIDLLGPALRDAKNLARPPQLDDLP